MSEEEKNKRIVRLGLMIENQGICNIPLISETRTLSAINGLEKNNYSGNLNLDADLFTKEQFSSICITVKEMLATNSKSRINGLNKEIADLKQELGL